MLLQFKVLLIVLENIRPDCGLELAATCRLIDGIVGLWVTLLSCNTYSLITQRGCIT